jgi:hypothetical protein
MRKTVCTTLCALLLLATRAFGADQIYFPATTNVTNILVQKINAETVRLDISSWYLSEHAISIAIANRFAAGVPVRIMGDRGAIFEADPHTKDEFYWLANKGIPIRLRFNPTWFPEINHWKMALFVGQNVVAFGSANLAPTELAPVSATNYSDETVLFADDPSIVNAFKTKFDVMWNDTTFEPQSIISGPPYFKDWYDACANEPTGNCNDFATRYPNPAPMVVNTARLEGDNPLPADLVWGQGRDFNNRLVQEINKENSRIDLIVYRLAVDNITSALLSKFQAGVPMRIIVDPHQYTNVLYPEYWLTHANIDKLWAAGVPILQTKHAGVTHMKTLVTSTYATNASSNFGPNWERDHNYFVPKATKPAIYQAIADRVDAMWNDTVGFEPLKLTKPNAATLASPAAGEPNVATTTSLVWNIAAWAVSYDVYLGTTSANMTLAGNVAARMVTNPPSTYSFTPSSLQPGTTYFWKVVSRTNATPLDPTMIATSLTRSFTTAGTATAPPAPSSPNPASGATGVSTGPVLSWTGGGTGTTYNVAFGTANPPPQVATGLTTASFTPGTLTGSTTYFWKVTAVSSGGTTAGPVWSFATGSGGGAPPEVVIYADDVPAGGIHGSWSQVPDATAADGIKLSNTDAGAAALTAPLASPTHYFDVTFDAVSGRRYRVWLRMRAIGNSKYNDSVFVQFSDSTNSGGSAIYRIGTAGALMVNLATDANATSLQGWGWQRNAYWLSDTGDVWFQNSGTHTIRVQAREDGAEIDQIVISPAIYANSSPGSVSNDTIIVPKPGSSQPPAAPASPSPVSGATGVGTTPTLTWSASGATSYDVRFGTSNPPPQVSSGQAAASFTTPTLVNNTSYFWQIVARNASGTATGPVWSFTTGGTQSGNPEIVIYAADIPPANLHGSWSAASDPSSPGGVKLVTTDTGFAAANNALAAPADYVDVTFDADANKPYRLWLRLQALNNSKYNDSLWVQFSDAKSNGASIYPMNTTSGLDVNLATDANATSLNRWGWQNGAYWLSQATSVTFATSGTHTLRIQVREDGVQLDQIVLSSSQFLTSAPGGVTNDSTIVPKP